MRKRFCYVAWAGLFCLFIHVSYSQDFLVNIRDIKYPVQPTMWGLFFEDINRSADGGIYAELVKNRSFDFPDPLMGWYPDPPRNRYAKNDIFQVINQSAAFPSDPKYLQVSLATAQPISLANEGFGGVSVKKGLPYQFTLRYRQQVPGITLQVAVNDASGREVGSVAVEPDPGAKGWQILTATLTPTDTTVKGRLVLRFKGMGRIDVDRVSLFPTDTWKGEKGSLRSDLVQKLADIKPGFMRFPGGCIVEGTNTDTRYQWKQTIGALEDRKLNSNQWSLANPKRLLPDYFQSYGVGFYEYFTLCEDIGASPMPILNCGISCQFDGAEVVPVDQLDPYIQDALDLVEFANGSLTTRWGKRRAELGHPAPFNLQLLGIGNENWGPQYVERLRIFTQAIKAKYPDIQLISSTGYSPNPQFKYMDSVLRKERVDIIDEHYYQTVNWFLSNAGKYDHYDRQGPKIFIGEYACHSVRIGSQDNLNTLQCAMAEAAWMTGLERNADIVTMAAYAPLFAHVKDWQWTPNLIWFDNTSSYATPSYYVQQLFSLNKGTDVVPMTVNGHAVAGQDSIWASAVLDRKTNELVIKIVNPSGTAKSKTIAVPGVKGTKGIAIVLKGNPADMNSIERPDIVMPVRDAVQVMGAKVTAELPACSLSVIRIGL